MLFESDQRSSAINSATVSATVRLKVYKNVVTKGAGESMNSALNDYHFSYHKTQKINKDSKPVGGAISVKEHITFDDMLKCCWPSYHTVMYDAEKIGRLKTLNQRQENDYALWLQAAYKADCYLLDECLAKHRANKWFYNPFPIGNNIEWRYEVYRKIEDLGPFISALYTIRNIWYGIWKKIKYVSRESKAK